MALIDKEQIRAEIEFAKSVYSNPKRVVHGVADAFRQDGRAAMCDDILKLLDTLPEQPVEGLELEQEILSYIRGMGFGYGGWVDGLEDEDLCKLARHFAEWGAKQKSIEIFKKQNCQGCGTQRCIGDGEWLEGCKAFQAWKAEHLKK